MISARHYPADPSVFPPRGGEYIPILDGWRAMAILLVLFFHGLRYTNPTGRPYLVHLSYLSGRTGALGVLVFFCISGYLITLRLLAESRIRGTISIRAFYLKRTFRILPPLVIYLFILVVLSAVGAIQLTSRDWSAPLFLANYWHGSWYTSHFWSLSVEEHFYLLWPACVIVAGWRRAMWIGVSLIFIVGVWRPWELHHAASQAAALQHTDMRLDYIMMGCVVALASNFYPLVARGLKALGSFLGLTSLFAALLLSTLAWHFDIRSIQAVIITLLVCSSSAANSRISRGLFANPIMLFIGKISYSLYVWQQLILGPQSHPFLQSPAALPIKLAASIIVATLSYYLIEKPFIKFGRTLLDKPSVSRDIERVRRVDIAVRA